MREQIKRASGRAHLGGGNAQIAGGGSQAAMAEQELNSRDVGALFEKVNGKCMAQRMGVMGLESCKQRGLLGIPAPLHHG